MMLKTARTSQTLEYHGSTQISLQAHRDLHEKLQVRLLLNCPAVLWWSYYVIIMSDLMTDGVCCVGSSFFMRRQKLQRQSGTS